MSNVSKFNENLFNDWSKMDLSDYKKEYFKKFNRTSNNIETYYEKYVELYNSDNESSSNDETDSVSEESESDSDSEIYEEKFIIICPDNIRTYNKQLIYEKKNPSIVEYVKELNEKFYKIDISFIDDFLKIIGIDECIIPHIMLEKYDVLKLKDSSYFTRKMADYKLLENIDYKINAPNVGGIKKRGVKSTNYLLNPDAFKLCLMRSLKTMKYAKYFLLLEKCVKYFNDFHLERNLIYQVSFKKLVNKRL